MSCNCNCGGSVMVVEYLESNMSEELLGKFPDNSAFDFDYSQSTIWSPLVPRNFSTSLGNKIGDANGGRGLQILALGLDMISSSTSSTSVQRKLLYDEDEEFWRNNATTLEKVAADIKRKIATTLFCGSLENYGKCNLHKRRRNKNKTQKAFDFSPNPNYAKGRSATTPTKVWAKVLKAASKHFKKTTKKNSSSFIARNKISKCATGATF